MADDQQASGFRAVATSRLRMPAQLATRAMAGSDMSIKPSTPQKPCYPRRETISRSQRIAGMLFIAGLLAILTVAYFAGGPHP